MSRFSTRPSLESAVFFVSLALGLACVLFSFSVLKPTLLYSLPYPDPERLAVGRLKIGSSENFLSPHMYRQLEESSKSWELLAASQRNDYYLEGTAYPGARVSSSWFQVLGVQPALGRLFNRSEDFASEPVLIVSHAFWSTVLGSLSDLSAARVRIGELEYSVVGVLPPSFRPPPSLLPPNSALYEPMGGNVEWGSATSFSLRVLGRLKDPSTQRQALEDLTHISSNLGDLYRSRGQRLVPQVELLRDVALAQFASRLGLFFLAGIILVVICFNLAGLSIGRLLPLRRSLAIRSALGASSWSLLRLLLGRLMRVSALAGAFGLLIVYWLHVGLSQWIPANIFQLGDWKPDRYDAVALAASVLLASLIIASFCLPIIRQPGLASLLNGQGGGTPSRYSRKTIMALTGLQLAFSVFIAIGSAAVLRHTWQLLSEEVGVTRLEALAVIVNLDPARYDTRGTIIDYVETALSRVQDLPQVLDAAVTNFAPLGGQPTSTYPIGQGTELPPERSIRMCELRVSSGYFKVLGIPIVAGRDFSERKPENREVIVDRTLARTLWQEGEAIGKVWEFRKDRPVTVIGVAEDARYNGPGSEDVPSIYYYFGNAAAQRIEVLISAADMTPQLRQDILARLRSVDPQQPIGAARTLREMLSFWTGRERFLSFVLTCFALLAVVVGMAGVYSSALLEARSRRQEAFVRTALGAGYQDIIRLFLLDTARIAVLSSLLGLAAMLAGSRLFQSLAGPVSFFDPVLWVLVPMAISTVALLSSLMAILKLKRPDPIELLRSR